MALWEIFMKGKRSVAILRFLGASQARQKAAPRLWQRYARQFSLFRAANILFSSYMLLKKLFPSQRRALKYGPGKAAENKCVLFSSYAHNFLWDPIVTRSWIFLINSKSSCFFAYSIINCFSCPFIKYFLDFFAFQNIFYSSLFS